MNLIIVESPTKAKTFNKLVNKKDYLVVSSMGHVRDLPKGTLGIDIEHDFKPDYQILENKKKVVSQIVKSAKQAREVILATDPDREGEAIAFHVKTVLAKRIKNCKFKRIVFHEITEDALNKALKESKEIDLGLFNAQQARRVLDRLFGYKLSPYLWKRFGKRWLSAGRVQSVALRLIVEREKECQKFKSQAIFLIKGQFLKKRRILPPAKLTKLAGKKYFHNKTVELFDGKYTYQTTLITKVDEKNKQLERLQKESFFISKLEESVSKRQPPPPFTTSALQQYGSSYLGYSAKRTMRIAQQLYEQGLITYHRTDSTYLSAEFLTKARSFIKKKYGQPYLEPKVRYYKTKAKLAQEAHEAIRPTKAHYCQGSSQLAKLRADQLKLYLVIYNRAIATQMMAAKIKNQKIIINSKAQDELLISNQQIIFPGYLVLSDFDKNESLTVDDLKPNTEVVLKNMEIEEKQTQGPPRYSEASLIKTLEAKGIGRPSTYAPIVSLIQERQYVEKKGRELVPSVLGIKIAELLADKFSGLLNPVFTAKMENELDMVALNKKKWVQTVENYYQPFSKQLTVAEADNSKIKVEETTGQKCPECGGELVIKVSRYGKFYACSQFPKCRYTKNYLQSLDITCPKCNQGKVVVRFSKKKRKFYACSRYPKCDYTSLWPPKKPKE